MNNTSIKYDAVIDICDRINSVVKDINEQFQKMNNFSNNKNSFWKGTAADKFYAEISKRYKEVPEVTEKTLPLYLETIKEIVEQNRATDTEINAEQIAKIGFSVPTLSTPMTGGSNIKTISGIGTVKTSEKTQTVNKTNTTGETKNLNNIGSNVKQNDNTVNSVPHSNSTASGTISLSELLKFIK